MNAIERLTSLFEKFPGIGPRQAGRFVHFLLRSSSSLRRELIDAVRSLAESIHQCSECMRYHSEKGKICEICGNRNREASLLAIVASDADLTALEKSGIYRGYYFVLGGTVHLASEKNEHLRFKQVLASIPARVKHGLKEIILAFPANPEGDMTAQRLREELGAQAKNYGSATSIIVTTLGRGLSTGSELEYADPETLKNALESRR